MRLFQEAMARLADRHVQDPIPASLSVALPILQGAADEDRDELVDLWARLLANAMDPNLNSVRQSIIDAVKKMDPVDAVVLQHVHEAKIDFVYFASARGLDSALARGTAYNISSAINHRRMKSRYQFCI